MRKKTVIIGVAVVLAAALGLWILLRPKALGNISRSCDLPESGLSRISFPAEAGERFRVSFTTQAQAGTVALAIRDAQGDLVESLGQARRLEVWVVLPEKGVYTLEAEYEEFVGQFQARIAK